MLHGKRLVCRLQNFQFFDCHTVSTTLLSAFCCHLLSATPQPFFFPQSTAILLNDPRPSFSQHFAAFLSPQSTAFFSPHSPAIFSPHSTAILHSALRSHFLSALRSHPFLHTPQSSFSQYSTAILLAVLHSHPFLSTPQQNGRESPATHSKSNRG